MAQWSDETPEMKATRAMFTTHYGNDARARWQWEDRGKPGTWEQYLSDYNAAGKGTNSIGGNTSAAPKSSSSSSGSSGSGSSGSSGSSGGSSGGSSASPSASAGDPALAKNFKAQQDYDKALLKQQLTIEKDKLDYSYSALKSKQQQDQATLKAQIDQAKKQLDFDYAELKSNAADTAAELQLDTWYKQESIKIDQQAAALADKTLELDQWYKGESIKLLQRTADLERDKFGLDQQQFVFDQDKFALTHGLDAEKFAFEQEKFGQTFGLEQQKFRFDQQKFADTMGLDVLKTGVEYAQNPADYVMASNWAQGIASNPRYASAVNGLVEGQNARLFGAAGGAPQAANLNGLAGQMGGGGSTAGSTAADQLASGESDGGAYDLTARAARAQSLVNAGSTLVQRGGGSLGAQALESQDPITRGLTASGVQGAGGSWDTLLQQYKNSRVAQGLAKGL